MTDVRAIIARAIADEHYREDAVTLDDAFAGRILRALNEADYEIRKIPVAGAAPADAKLIERLRYHVDKMGPGFSATAEIFKLAADRLAALSEQLTYFGELASQHADELNAKIASLSEALENLVNKLDAVHRDPMYVSVWTVSQLHVGPYKGPTYTEELALARAALIKAPPP